MQFASIHCIAKILKSWRSFGNARPVFIAWTIKRRGSSRPIFSSVPVLARLRSRARRTIFLAAVVGRSAGKNCWCTSQSFWFRAPRRAAQPHPRKSSIEMSSPADCRSIASASSSKSLVPAVRQSATIRRRRSISSSISVMQPPPCCCDQLAGQGERTLRGERRPGGGGGFGVNRQADRLAVVSQDGSAARRDRDRSAAVRIHRRNGTLHAGKQREVATVDLLTKIAEKPAAHLRELLTGGGAVAHGRRVGHRQPNSPACLPAG